MDSRRNTHSVSLSYTHMHMHMLFGVQGEDRGGGVEVSTDHFGIKVAAAADMKSSNGPVGRRGEFLH